MLFFLIVSQTMVPRSIADKSRAFNMEFPTSGKEIEAFLARIVTGSEIWLYQCDSEGKMQPKARLPGSGSHPVQVNRDWATTKVSVAVAWGCSRQFPC